MNNEQYGKDEMDEMRKSWTAAAQTEAPDSRPKRHWLKPDNSWELAFILALIIFGVGSYAYLEYIQEPARAAAATAAATTAASTMPSTVETLPKLRYTPSSPADLERRQVSAGCRLIYITTIDKRTGDLTTREEGMIRACRVMGMYPPD